MTRRERLLDLISTYLEAGWTATATAAFLFDRAAEEKGETAAFLTDAGHLANVEARRRSRDGRYREARAA